MHEAYHRFGRDWPTAPDVAALLQEANLRLARYVDSAGVLHSFGFDTYRRGGERYMAFPLVIDLLDDSATLRFDQDQPASWVVLQRSLAIIAVIDRMMLGRSFGPMRFLADTTDAAHVARACFCSAVPGSCLLPDSDFIGSNGYESTRRLVNRHHCAWAERRPTAFWRGATTGQRRHMPPGQSAEADDFKWLPRLDLCFRASKSPQAGRYDVGIAGIARIAEPHLLARIEASGFCKPRVTRDAFLNHKAIIVIDGNANAWSALFCALLTGACVLKVVSPRGFKQWYYDDLVPWKHYVPVSEDMHDLDERVDWVFANEGAAQEIGAAGRAFAESMTFEAVVEAGAERLLNWLPTARAVD